MGRDKQQTVTAKSYVFLIGLSNNSVRSRLGAWWKVLMRETLRVPVSGWEPEPWVKMGCEQGQLKRQDSASQFCRMRGKS